MMYKNIFLLLGQSSSAKRSAELAAKEKYFCLRFGKTGSVGGDCGTRGLEEYFCLRFGKTGSVGGACGIRSLEEYFFIVMERARRRRTLFSSSVKI